MTREAAREGFELFVDDVINLAYEEFDVIGAIRQGARGGGSKAVSTVLKRSDALDQRVVQPLLDEHRATVVGQFDHVLDYAADENAAFEEYAPAVLGSDMYFESLRPGVDQERQAEIEQRLLQRQRALGDAVTPLLRSDESEFWPAVTDVFTESEARTFVQQHFAFTAPLNKHREAFTFQTVIDPAELISGPFSAGLPSLAVDYTDEVVRTMQTAEATVIDQTFDRIDEQFR